MDLGNGDQLIPINQEHQFDFPAAVGQKYINMVLLSTAHNWQIFQVDFFGKANPSATKPI